MGPNRKPDAELIEQLLTDPTVVEKLSGDQLVSQILAQAGLRHAQLANLQISLLRVSSRYAARLRLLYQPLPTMTVCLRSMEDPRMGIGQ